MVSVDQDKCIGCGQCISDCFGHNLQMTEGKAQVMGSCFQCGHCTAVCPVQAFQISDYPVEDIEECRKEQILSPGQLLHMIKSRRSVRHYQKKEVEETVIREILQAGRFTPTAGNAQDVSYIVVQKQLPQMIPLIWQGLKTMAERIYRQDSKNPYSALWERMYQNYQNDPEKEDHLFFGAPVLLVITAEEKVNGWLAASNIELMANAMGLGCLYSGFIERAIQNQEEVQKILHLDGKRICACILMGYPGITYKRTAPRKELQVIWR